MKRDRAVDHVGSTVSLILAALPEFVIGIGLVLLFATSVFQWFPAVSLLAPGEKAWEAPKYVVLPAATLVLAVTPYISRIMRGSMIEVLESEYVTMARLKGLSERTVIWRHAVPNAIVPAIQVAALQLAWMAGGVVVVEFVFSYPGHRRGAGRRGRQPRHAGRADGRDARRGRLRADEPGRRPGDDPRHAEAEDGGAMSNQAVDTAVGVGLEVSPEPAGPGAPAVQRHAWLGILRNALRLGRTQDRHRDRDDPRADRAVRPARRPALADRVHRRAEHGPVVRRAVRHRRARPRRLEPLPQRRPQRALDVGRRDAARRRPRRRSSASSRRTRATGSTTC